MDGGGLAKLSMSDSTILLTSRAWPACADYKRKPGEEEDRDENKAPAQDQYVHRKISSSLF